MATQTQKRMCAVSMNLIDLIVLDHERVRAMWDCYKTPNIQLPQKQLLAWELISELSQHAAKEEMVLYPAMRSALGDGPTDRCLADHAGVKALMAQLDTMVAGDGGFDAQVTRVVEDSLRHMEEEEADHLQRLAQAVTDQTLMQLGIQFEAAKARSPTRPHPEAPNLPPFNESTYAAAKQIDTVLDQSRMPSVVPPTIELKRGATAVAMQPAGPTGIETTTVPVPGGGGAAAMGPPSTAQQVLGI